MMLGRLQRLAKYALIVALIFFSVIFVFQASNKDTAMDAKDAGFGHHIEKEKKISQPTGAGNDIRERAKPSSVFNRTSLLGGDGSPAMPNYNIHAFYYAWYGNPGQDGQYYHWNHEYLPHWLARISAQFPTGQKHIPPNDIGASFYPQLSPYSSLDESITRTHMLQMQEAGIGVLALSWYPPGQADDNGKPIESYVPTIFDVADEFNIKVCFHIEPYKGRNAATIHDNIKYILDKYGQHPAFYHHLGLDSTVKLPLIYVYDSYQVDESEWRKLLKKDGEYTIRNTNLDALIIGLLVEGKHMGNLVSAGFDGFYTYFAADGFSYGSTRENWHNIAQSAQLNKMIFIPSIGPGYDDTKVRPWNSVNSCLRRNGAYYIEGWEEVSKLAGVETVSITSFNEWHEGTQIEPADTKPRHGGFSYLTYAPNTPEFYLKLTREWSMKFLHQKKRIMIKLT